MQNFRQGLPPLVSEDDLFPLHWIWYHPSALASGWSFSLALLAILLTHEVGHSFFCRRHGISASWPYVLPAPTLSGHGRGRDSDPLPHPLPPALIEVGIAGPIAGYVVALFTSTLGLLLSRPAGAGSAAALVQFHQPLTIACSIGCSQPSSRRASNGQPAAASHPGSKLGGSLCHLTQLIPAGQLDGGHILYAISPRWHRRTTFVVPIVLLVMGVTLWTGWILWGVILLLRPCHLLTSVTSLSCLQPPLALLGGPGSSSAYLPACPVCRHQRARPLPLEALYIRLIASTSTIRLRRG